MASEGNDRGGLLSAGGILSIIVGAFEIIGGGLAVAAIKLGTSFWHPRPSFLPGVTDGFGIGAAPTWLIIAGIAIIVLGIVAVFGGISAINRKSFGLSLAGAICAFLPFNIVGLLAIIFVSLGKGEFGAEY